MHQLAPESAYSKKTNVRNQTGEISMLKQNKKGKWVVDHWYFGLNKKGERQRLKRTPPSSTRTP